MVAYAFASASDKPALTRIIDAYQSRREEVERRNTLHQIACERAAVDRHLFHGEKGAMIGIDLRFPECVVNILCAAAWTGKTLVSYRRRFNQASPWNVC